MDNVQGLNDNNGRVNLDVLYRLPIVQSWDRNADTVGTAYVPSKELLEKMARATAEAANSENLRNRQFRIPVTVRELDGAQMVRIGPGIRPDMNLFRRNAYQG